jgi:hypothetical protein
MNQFAGGQIPVIFVFTNAANESSGSGPALANSKGETF